MIFHMYVINDQRRSYLSICHSWFEFCCFQYAISQLRFVRSDLHLVTYLDVGNFCDKSTKTTLHEICAQVFLRFSDSNKPSQSVSLIYEFAWLAGFRKSEENLLKASCKNVPVVKVAHIFWWRHDNHKNNWQVAMNVDATLVAIFLILHSYLQYHLLTCNYETSYYCVGNLGRGMEFRKMCILCILVKNIESKLATVPFLLLFHYLQERHLNRSR